ncbi:uncharacterized protein LOC127378442 isoform X2 [Dicentrarchus labrax]|uniref:uncharacterized protein LOC127378442 isoform X2 n=1 Tax=Dicentrarchus labrax TaxID=13489 RepID=UPI0021F5948B|nr:uncharacterized protein LOC127378442 isoform X2 [Dicentrarchus labrax]
MKGTAKSKVVTSGRLAGRVKVQPAKRRVTLSPGPTACPEPAYSLYSTDSEDQVTSLHKGLDRCAALLSGILQAEKAAMPSLPTAVMGGATKSRPSTSLGQRSCHSVQRAPGSTTPRATRQPTVPAAHSGVKLHPPQKRPHTPLQSHLPASQRQTFSAATPPPDTSTPPPHPHLDRLPLPQTDCRSDSEALRTDCREEFDREEEDFVPVKDINTQSTATDTHTAVRHTHIHTCTMKMSKMQLESGQVDKVPQDAHSMEDCSAETEVKVKTVHYLLRELKALITGQGSVAERLISHLEQTVSVPQVNGDSSNIQSEPDLSSLHSQNTLLRRRVKTLQQQLKEREKAERQQNMETLFNSEVFTLQEELTVAQSQLHEVQEELAELQKALQDTQSQLRDRDAQNALIMTELEATRSKLLNSEREKSELALLAQQRLEEIGHLSRTLQSQNPSECYKVVDSSVSDTLVLKHFEQHQHRQDPAEPPTDRITQYLMSLGQPEPAEREGNTLEQKKLTLVKLRDTLSRPDVKPKETSACHQNPHIDQSHHSDKIWLCGRLLNSTLSQCDVESVWSNCSVRSGSTFDTRDEAAFRDGLSALDASIASLQKTIQLDLGR